jgi:hypothetical protein
VPLLEGLARLLELLAGCFNVSLGEKLQEHLTAFANPDTVTRMRYEALTDKSGMTKIKPEDEASAHRRARCTCACMWLTTRRRSASPPPSSSCSTCCPRTAASWSRW